MSNLFSKPMRLLTMGIMSVIKWLELDYMEYATDGDAQAAYVSNAVDGIKDSYSETNQDETTTLIDVHPSATTLSADGQAFTAPSTFSLTRCKFYLAKVGSPTGNIVAKLYAATGTMGTNATATGSALATSAVVDSSTLSTSPTFTLQEFVFSGSLYELQSGSNYCIILEAASQTIDASNYPAMGRDGSSPTHSGNRAYYYAGSWGADSARDLCFYIYGIVLQSYSESTIKQQGSYSLKGVATITDSLNKTLTRTVSPTIDLSGVDTINFDIYASRTGSNIRVEIYKGGISASYIVPNVVSANIWQTVNWDISAVINADKDAIDSITITPINADTVNTFYIDKMRYA